MALYQIWHYIRWHYNRYALDDYLIVSQKEMTKIECGNSDLLLRISEVIPILEQVFFGQPGWTSLLE